MTDVFKRRLSTLVKQENSRIKKLVHQHSFTLRNEEDQLKNEIHRSDVEEIQTALESLNQQLKETAAKRKSVGQFQTDRQCSKAQLSSSRDRGGKKKHVSNVVRKDVVQRKKLQKMGPTGVTTKENAYGKSKQNDSKRRQAGSKNSASNFQQIPKSPGPVDKKEEAKRRKTRMEQTQKRRTDIETRRIERLQRNSGVARQKRIKKKSAQEKERIERIQHWLLSIQLGSRLQIIKSTVMNFRAYKSQLELEDYSAKLITRQMRIYKFKRYRKRIKGAIFVLGSVFVMKVKLWKLNRRASASNKVRAFLVSLDEANRKTNGCLAKVIVKGKKWRAYRQKIVVLQRLWRAKMRTFSAQALLIDLQWKAEQSRRTENYIDLLYKSSTNNTTIENEKIEAINRTRKLIKLRPLPRLHYDSRELISDQVLKGKDLLSVGNIVPAEIRLGIIQDMLRCLRFAHMQENKRYIEHLELYNQDILRIQRQRAIIVSFSGSQVANAWVNAQHNERQLAKSVVSKEPKKPRFRTILDKSTLEILISTGEQYVRDIRDSWKPETMNILDSKFDGRKAAEAHLKQAYEYTYYNTCNQAKLEK